VASASLARSGNGIGALNANEVLARSADALAKEKNLVVDGKLNYDKEAITFNVRSSGRGKDVAGTLTIRTGTQAIGPVTFVDLPSALYLRAGAPFWRAEIASIKSVSATAVNAAVAKIAGRWIEVTGSEAATFSSSFGELTEPGKFAQSLLKGNGTLTKGAPKVLRDHLVLPIMTSDGATIFIALTGAPVPVEISGTSTVKASTVSLDALINTPARLAIKAPHGAETLASLSGTLAS
jgi:hypothetical protein